MLTIDNITDSIIFFVVGDVKKTYMVGNYVFDTWTAVLACKKLINFFMSMSLPNELDLATNSEMRTTRELARFTRTRHVDAMYVWPRVFLRPMPAS